MERDRERDRERETEKETERDSESKTERAREREREAERKRKRQRETKTKRDEGRRGNQGIMPTGIQFLYYVILHENTEMTCLSNRLWVKVPYELFI